MTIRRFLPAGTLNDTVGIPLAPVPTAAYFWELMKVGTCENKLPKNNSVKINNNLFFIDVFF